jgi:hypothetical protein
MCVGERSTADATGLEPCRCEPAYVDRIRFGPILEFLVAVTEMHGSGVFFDARLGNKGQYPIAAKSGSGNMRGTPDQVTSKLAALHFYQLAIAAPTPPANSFDADAGVMMQRGRRVLGLRPARRQEDRTVT